MRNQLYYEWIVEFLDDTDPADNDPDIYETSAFPTYAEALKASKTWETTSKVRIGLTRNVGNDIEGLTDRAWAYVDPETNKLAREFNYGNDQMTGITVPARFQNAINKGAK